MADKDFLALDINHIMEYLHDNDFRPFSAKEEKEVFKRLKQTNDPELKNEIILRNMGLVVSFVRQIVKDYKTVSFEDAISDGCIGLMRAIELYDPEKDNKFSTYAYYWIKQNVIRGSKDFTNTIRVPDYQHGKFANLNKFRRTYYEENGEYPTETDYIECFGSDIEDDLKEYALYTAVLNMDSLNREIIADADELSTVEFFIKDPGAEEAFLDIEKRELTELINEMIEGYSKTDLKNKERNLTIIKRRFGLDGYECETLENIGKDYGLTRERVRQISDKFIKYLKLPKNKRRLEAYKEVINA